MLGKTFKGMTDEMLRWQTERFRELEVSDDGWVVTVRPEQVVEIAFDGRLLSIGFASGRLPTLPVNMALIKGFSLMGVALEYAQGMTGYRSFAYGDMRDNLLGAGIGLALSWTPLGNVLAAVENRFGKVRFRGTA